MDAKAAERTAALEVKLDAKLDQQDAKLDQQMAATGELDVKLGKQMAAILEAVKG